MTKATKAYATHSDAWPNCRKISITLKIPNERHALLTAVTTEAHNIALSKRAWLAFTAVQTLGCILSSYGTVYSGSAFVRGSWLIGFLLLLPGNLPAMAVGQTLIHVRTAYIFFPIAIVCNAMLWTLCSRLWRTLRHTATVGDSRPYSISLAATGLVFVIANTIHFLRPAMCDDCFFPYGLPFTLYHEGGYAGGAGFAWGGLAADIGCVVIVGLVVGRSWERLTRPRVRG